MMKKDEMQELPQCVRRYIGLVVRKIRFAKTVRREVREELVMHFLDALDECETLEERERFASELVLEFGDADMIGRLLGRGKKRCRPLWLRAIIGTMQIVGIVLLLVIARGVYLSVGTAVISVDYVQWMNDHVRSGRDDDLNALPYYEKAVQLSKDVPEELKGMFSGLLPEEFTAEQWDAVEEFLAEDAKALDALREGAAKPYYWNVYQGKSSAGSVPDMTLQVTGGVMPTIGEYKKLAMKVIRLQIPWSLHIGDIEKAVDDSIVLHRLARHLHSQGLLIEQLVGVAIDAVAYFNTFQLISDHDLTADKLEYIQGQLEEIFADDVGYDLEGEKAFMYDFIQCTFTDDGKGSGRAMKEGLVLAADDLKGMLKGFVAGYPSRAEVTKSIDRYYEQIAELSKQTPWQLKDSDRETLATENFMLNISDQGLRKSIETTWRLKAGRLALVTAVAVKRYEKDKGGYPAGLDELVGAGYLKELPMDPYSGGALGYERIGGDFVLYSFGDDMKGDGGQIGTKQGKPVKWADNGDWVFWPVEQP